MRHLLKVADGCNVDARARMTHLIVEFETMIRIVRTNLCLTKILHDASYVDGVKKLNINYIHVDENDESCVDDHGIFGVFTNRVQILYDLQKSWTRIINSYSVEYAWSLSEYFSNYRMTRCDVVVDQSYDREHGQDQGRDQEQYRGQNYEQEQDRGQDYNDGIKKNDQQQLMRQFIYKRIWTRVDNGVW